MGEAKNRALKVRIDRRLRLEFHGSRTTPDAGLLACRKLDEALGLSEGGGPFLKGTCFVRNVQHHLVALVRQSLYSRIIGLNGLQGELRG